MPAALPPPLDLGTVLVVGTGGLGTPCAWALADAGPAAGLSRLVLVDPDRVEGSNLPRQVLFGPADVGRPKAEAAARRLERPGLRVDARVARFDGATADDLLDGVSVVVDATDGASTKDLVHGLAVAAGLPVVHAAAVGSEGRLLDVPAGGRPCFACLFGLLASGDEGDTCARFGVWPGVVGAVGFLAAAAAIERLAAPRAPSRGLRVLDLGADRAVTLGATADRACPVCGEGADPRALLEARRAAAALDGATTCAPPDVLDLRDESCPMNLLRARKAVDALAPGESLGVWLGDEGADSVPEGLAALGHSVEDRERVGVETRLRVRRRAVPTTAGPSSSRRNSAGDDRWLRRYARQIVLPEVGEEGQRTWGEACVVLAGTGDAAMVCAVYLASAGIGSLALDDATRLDASDRTRWPFAADVGSRTRAEALAEVLGDRGHVVPGAGDCAPAASQGRVSVQPEDESWDVSVVAPGAGPIACARGALLADAVMRRVLDPKRGRDRVRVNDDGTVSS